MANLILKIIKKKEDLVLLSSAYRKGDLELNISELSRELKVDRKKIRNYLKDKIPKRNRNRKKYLDEYKELIKSLLNDEEREFLYIDHLYRYLIREHNIKCNKVTFNRYKRTNEELNKLFKESYKNHFTVRFETKIGQQIQFDLKEKVLLITKTGEKHLVYIPTITFGWSRYNYRKIVLDTKIETLINFLAEAFNEFDGVPQEIVIDNLKAFVEKSRYKDQPAILNAKFEEFCKDYGILVKACTPRMPQTKCKIDTQNKIVDELRNYNGHYKDLDDIHDKLEIINKEDNEAISQATKLPRIFLFNKEKGELSQLPSKEIMAKYHLKLKEVHVQNDSLISYKSHKYSIPKKYIGFKVGLVVMNNELHIYYNNKIITKHIITEKIINIKPEHELVYDDKKDAFTKKESNKIVKELENIIYD